jgi:AcrR family transcriptional regulator
MVKPSPKAAPKEKIPPKEKITGTAFRLFDTQGVHLTGINQIIEESGVAKKTFYAYFPSKDDLIVAYLTEKDRVWFGRLEEHVAAGKTPRDRILAIFDYLEVWYAEADFCGCPFIRGLSEFQAKDTPKAVQECMRRHFEGTHLLVESLLKDVRPKDYAKWVPAFLTLITGSAIVAQATGDARVAQLNRRLADDLLSRK